MQATSQWVTKGGKRACMSSHSCLLHTFENAQTTYLPKHLEGCLSRPNFCRGMTWLCQHLLQDFSYPDNRPGPFTASEKLPETPGPVAT
jgi:hypothetical protein